MRPTIKQQQERLKQLAANEFLAMVDVPKAEQVLTSRQRGVLRKYFGNLAPIKRIARLLAMAPSNFSDIIPRINERLENAGLAPLPSPKERQFVWVQNSKNHIFHTPRKVIRYKTRKSGANMSPAVEIAAEAPERMPVMDVYRYCIVAIGKMFKVDASGEVVCQGMIDWELARRLIALAPFHHIATGDQDADIDAMAVLIQEHYIHLGWLSAVARVGIDFNETFGKTAAELERKPVVKNVTINVPSIPTPNAHLSTSTVVSLTPKAAQALSDVRAGFEATGIQCHDHNQAINALLERLADTPGVPVGPDRADFKERLDKENGK